MSFEIEYKTEQVAATRVASDAIDPTFKSSTIGEFKGPVVIAGALGHKDVPIIVMCVALCALGHLGTWIVGFNCPQHGHVIMNIREYLVLMDFFRSGICCPWWKGPCLLR